MARSARRGGDQEDDEGREPGKLCRERDREQSLEEKISSAGGRRRVCRQGGGHGNKKARLRPYDGDQSVEDEISGAVEAVEAAVEQGGDRGSATLD